MVEGRIGVPVPPYGKMDDRVEAELETTGAVVEGLDKKPEEGEPDEAGR